MATIKSYTSLEQSRKLAEILPLESSDMCYVWDYEHMCYTPELFSFIQNQDNEGVEHIDYPCWSLAALLDVLPNNENISTNLSKGGYRISTLEYTNSWFVDYEDETDGLNNCVTSADNPVDACYEMIIKLHEQTLL